MRKLLALMLVAGLFVVGCTKPTSPPKVAPKAPPIDSVKDKGDMDKGGEPAKPDAGDAAPAKPDAGGAAPAKPDAGAPPAKPAAPPAKPDEAKGKEPPK